MYTIENEGKAVLYLVASLDKNWVFYGKSNKRTDMVYNPTAVACKQI